MDVFARNLSLYRYDPRHGKTRHSRRSLLKPCQHTHSACCYWVGHSRFPGSNGDSRLHGVGGIHRRNFSCFVLCRGYLLTCKRLAKLIFQISQTACLGKGGVNGASSRSSSSASSLPWRESSMLDARLHSTSTSCHLTFISVRIE